MKFKAAIFDMDGLLIDSEIHWAKHYPAIWSQLGVVYTEDFGKIITGLRLRDAVIVAKSKYNKQLTLFQTRKVYKSYSKLVYAQDAKLLKGARELLEVLGKKGFLVALGSSASSVSINRVIKKHQLKAHFHLIISASDMRKGKPNPDVYLKIMKQLKIKPNEAVIFEDSLVGVKAAKASGAKVIAVPDKRWSHGDFSVADLVAKSLADKKIYSFLGIR